MLQLNDFLIKEHNINEMLHSFNQLPPLSKAFAFNMMSVVFGDMDKLNRKTQGLSNKSILEEYIKNKFEDMFGAYLSLYYFLVKQEPLFWQKFEETLQHIHQPITEIQQMVKVSVVGNDITQTYPINGFLSMDYQKYWYFDTNYRETELIYALEWRKKCDVSYNFNVRIRCDWDTQEIKSLIAINDSNSFTEFVLEKGSYEFKNKKSGDIIQSYTPKINENGQHALLEIELYQPDIEPHQPELLLLNQILPILKNLECINTNATPFNGVYTFNNVDELSLWLSQLLEQYGSLIGNVKTDFSSDIMLKLIQAYFPSPDNDDTYPLTIKLEEPHFQSSSHCECIIKRDYSDMDLCTEGNNPVDSIHRHLGRFPFLWKDRLTHCLAQCVFFDKALGVERIVLFYYDFNYHSIFMYSVHNMLKTKVLNWTFLCDDFNKLRQNKVMAIA